MTWNPFSRKVLVVMHEYGKMPEQIKGNIVYDRKTKEWFLKIGKEKIPAPENIYSYVICGAIHIVRKGTNTYDILDFKNLASTGEPANYRITPSDIYASMIKSQIRYERMKSGIERFIPIVFVVIAAIGIAVFFNILWSSIGQNIEKTSENFRIAMDNLNNITQTQLEISRMLAGRGEVVLAR
ncbi:MAG: hypothetical protein QXT63_07595 [Thermoplasmata archaeon]